MPKFLRRTLKVLGWTVGSILVLLLLVIVLVQLPGVQNFLKNKAVSYIEKKIGTRVEIRRLAIKFPKTVVLEGVYLEDQKHDTLLSGDKLLVDISMMKLLHSEVEVNDVGLEGIYANIYRKGTDTNFNYQYIVDAFVKPDTTAKDTTATPMKVNVKHVSLKRIAARFRDDESGSDMYGYVGDFETHIDRFDLDSMRFKVPDIRLHHVIARLYQHKPMVEPKTTAQVAAKNKEPLTLGLLLGKLDVADVDLDMVNDVSLFSARARVGELQAEPDSINLATLDIALKNFLLKNTTAVIHMGKSQQSKQVEQQVETSAATQAAKPWQFTVATTLLQGISLKFDNDNTPKVPRGIDYAHLDVDTLTLAAQNLQITPTAYMGNLERLSLYEKNSRFSLHRLTGDFLYGEKGVFLNNLYLETDKTILRDKLAVTWPSLALLATRPGEMGLGADLKDSRIGLSDVLLFVPTLAKAPLFYKNENAVFRINLLMDGQLKNLNIRNVEASGMQGTRLAASGRITGLPDPVRTIYNLNIRNVQTTSTDLPKLLPPGIIPNTVRIPEAIAMNGFFIGSAAQQNVKLNVRTSRGGVVVAGVINPGKQTYNLTASTANLDLGYILKQEKTMGRVTVSVAAKGYGFDPKKMNADIKARVSSAAYNGYTYRNVAVNARLNKGNMTAHAESTDPNIAFTADIDGSFKNKFPALRADMMIDSLNLQALHFYKDEFRFHGRVLANLSSTDPDALDGTVQVTNVLIATGGKRFTTDTISVEAAPSVAGRRIAIQSEALVADIDGQYKLTQLGAAVQEVINKYYTLPGYKATVISPQLWTANLKVIPSKLLLSFVPALEGSDTITAQAAFNSAAADLNLTANARRIVFGANAIDSLTVRANTAAALDYSVTMNSAGNKQFKLYRTALSGNVANNQLLANLDTKDLKGTSKYQLGATLNAIEKDGYRISLLPALLMNYQAWQVGANNYIQYDPQGIVVNNFSIANGTQSLSAASASLYPTAPINVQFNNFLISTITSIAEQDSLLVNGAINGTATVLDPAKNATFASDLVISDLSYKRDTVGNVTIKVDNKTENVLNADVRVEGHGNNISLVGRYLIPSQGMDMRLDITNINLASIAPFTVGQLDSAGGSLIGGIDIKGTVPKPQIAGTIQFQNAFVTPTLLGERFTLNENPISLNATGVHLDHFTLADSARNTAVIDGDVFTTDFKDYRFAIDVSAENFRAVNSTHGGTKKPFYGKLNLSTALHIGGNMNSPSVNGKLRINKGTDFSYILPSTDPEVQNREGVVKFVDMDAPGDTAIFAAGSSKDSLNRVAASGISLDAQIETDSDANFALVIDERNGDAIHLRGSADLAAGIDKSGKISLTGTYVLSEGSYLLTLNFLKRQFSIQPGSYLTWTGDPTSATVDITAIYLANTASLDLVQSQLAGRNASEINKYKQKLPFNVLLQMKGELLKPVITFDVELPARYASQWPEVESKLEQIRNDESELNKQVFAVLLLGHFVDQNPLESAAGSGNIAETYIRQSASRILTDQLNRLAGQLVKGVDINFGITSGADYSTGTSQQRTDLNVNVSKRLLNDRLRVNVGSAFELEGQKSNNSGASNIAGDVSLDYMLTKDGRYMVRAYRRNNYEALAEGQVVETGASISFQMDYDHIREFLRKKPKAPKDTSKSK